MAAPQHRRGGGWVHQCDKPAGPWHPRSGAGVLAGEEKRTSGDPNETTLKCVIYGLIQGCSARPRKGSLEGAADGQCLPGTAAAAAERPRADGECPNRILPTVVVTQEQGDRQQHGHTAAHLPWKYSRSGSPGTRRRSGYSPSSPPGPQTCCKRELVTVTQP